MCFYYEIVLNFYYIKHTSAQDLQPQENIFIWGGERGISPGPPSHAFESSHSWQSSFLGSSECVNGSCDRVYWEALSVSTGHVTVYTGKP